MLELKEDMEEILGQILKDASSPKFTPVRKACQAAIGNDTLKTGHRGEK